MALQFTYAPEKAAALSAPVAAIWFVQQQDKLEVPAAVVPQIAEELAATYAAGAFKGELEQTKLIATLGLAPYRYAVFVGVGKAVAADSLRLAAAAASRAIAKLQGNAVAHAPALPDGMDASRAAQALSEGFILGSDRRKKQGQKGGKQEEPAGLEVFLIPASAGQLSAEEAVGWERGAVQGAVFAAATCYARQLTNLPGNVLTPEQLAEEAELLASELGLDAEIIDEFTAAEEGMGGLLGVGQGSVNPPRMIVLHYEGAPDSQEVLGLIGKGITFDTGGISLKKAQGMEEMISDMGGAAAVLGAMRIIGTLKPRANVIAVIPTAENMPAGNALKPGDVITTLSGRTVEVVNTDAEGRLVLADGLTVAIRRGATRLIDVATLTGAVLVALGDVATGAISNNEPWLQEVLQASGKSGERIWQLPSYPDYRKQLDSDAADLKNTGGRLGGTITGGLFIGAFAEDLPWVHLDIAGTAWLHKQRGWESKGATGAMVRTLGELLVP